MKPFRWGFMGVLLGLTGCADWGPLGNRPSVPAQPPLATVPDKGASVPSKMGVTQPVALLLFHSSATLQLRIKSRLFTLKSPEDFILQSHRQEKSVQVPASDWVFVGYGVTVPALGLDHYQNMDVHGKTVVMLSGAPPIPDGTTVSSREIMAHPKASNLGHWRAKLENAQRHGADMALIIHDAAVESVPYAQWQQEFSETDVVLAAPPDAVPLVAYGWMPQARAQFWLQQAGVSLQQLKRKAAAANFTPIPLPIQSRVQIANRWREIELSVPR